MAMKNIKIEKSISNIKLYNKIL